MGLDMYLEGRKYFYTDYEKPENNLKEDGYEVKERILRLGYWRKHPDLHGFIVEQFADGKDECQDIDLGEEEMLKIIEAIKTDTLPNTSGFFFGASENDEEQKAEAIKTFEGAIAWLKNRVKNESRSVNYQASW